MKRAEHYAGIGVIAVAIAIALSWQSRGTQARSATASAPPAVAAPTVARSHDGGAGFRQLETGHVGACAAPTHGQTDRPENVLVEALHRSGIHLDGVCTAPTSSGTMTRQEPSGP